MAAQDGERERAAVTCDRSLFNVFILHLISLFLNELFMFNVTLCICMSWCSQVEPRGSMDAKMEADSYDITECLHDDEPIMGMLVLSS